jgi:hypothetical protein
MVAIIILASKKAYVSRRHSSRYWNESLRVGEKHFRTDPLPAQITVTLYETEPPISFAGKTLVRYKTDSIPFIDFYCETLPGGLLVPLIGKTASCHYTAVFGLFPRKKLARASFPS